MVFLDAFHYPDEVYNPDEVVPINSPLQKIVKTRFDSASKLPVLFQGEEDVDDFRLDTPWAPGLRVTGRTIVHSPRTSGSVLPSPVDAVLLHELCNGSIPSIGWKAQREMLPPVDFDTVLKRPDHEEPQRLLSSSAPFIRPPMQLNKQMNDTPNASAIDFKEQPSSPKKLASSANLSRVVLQEVESQDPKTPAALSATIETHPEFLQTEIHGELASTMARRRLGIPLSLPGRYGEMTVMSCADTGADENTMTLKEADRLGLKVTSDAEDLKEFCLANGKIIRSLGKAILPCKFSQGYASPDALVTVFYVFQTLVEPIIMGLKFLELTETLNKHRDRLVELEVPPNQPLRVLAMGALRRNLVCRLAKNTVFANADSGSDLDFMSGKYARTHSLALIPNAELIELADGTRVTTSGVVKLPLSVGELDTHDKSQNSRGSIELPSVFHVFDDMIHDVLIGHATIEKLKVFTHFNASLLPGLGLLDISGINIIRHLKNTPISKSIRNVFRRRRSRQSKKTGAPSQDGDGDQMENARHSMEVEQAGNVSTVAHQPQLQPLQPQEVTTNSGLAVPVSPLTPQSPPGIRGIPSMPDSTSPTSPHNPYTHSMPSPAAITSIYPSPHGTYPSNSFVPRPGPERSAPDTTLP